MDKHPELTAEELEKLVLRRAKKIREIRKRMML